MIRELFRLRRCKARYRGHRCENRRCDGLHSTRVNAWSHAVWED